MEQTELIVNGKNAILGRLASWAAKQARLGNKVIIVNADQVLISGKPKVILEKYLARFRLGRGAQKGPLYSRTVEGILKRAIRGMIRRKRAFGRAALKRVRCYEGIPKEYAEKEMISFEAKSLPLNFITLGQLSKLIRQK